MTVDGAGTASGSSSTGETMQRRPHTQGFLHAMEFQDQIATQATVHEMAKTNKEEIAFQDTEAIEAFLERPITNVRDVLNVVRAYHVAVIRPENRQITEQIEQFLIALNDRAIQHHENINWLLSDARRDQKQRSAVMITYTGFPRTAGPEARAYFIHWTLAQVQEVSQHLAVRGYTATLKEWEQSRQTREDGFPLFAALLSEPTTVRSGQDWATVTFVVVRSFDVRQAILRHFGGGEGIPYYSDSNEAHPGVHIKLNAATPQFQRKLEAPLRAFLRVVNECEGLADGERACTILWQSLTVMQPQTHKEFDHTALPMFRMEFHHKETGEVSCTIRLTKEAYDICREAIPERDRKPDDAIEAGATLWERAWNAQFYANVITFDNAEQAATDATRHAAVREEKGGKGYNQGWYDYAAKGKHKGTRAYQLGHGRHWSQQFTMVNSTNPFGIKTDLVIYDAEDIGFAWNEYCNKFHRKDLHTEDGAPPADRFDWQEAPKPQKGKGHGKQDGKGGGKTPDHTAAPQTPHPAAGGVGTRSPQATAPKTPGAAPAPLSPPVQAHRSKAPAPKFQEPAPQTSPGAHGAATQQPHQQQQPPAHPPSSAPPIPVPLHLQGKGHPMGEWPCQDKGYTGPIPTTQQEARDLGYFPPTVADARLAGCSGYTLPLPQQAPPHMAPSGCFPVTMQPPHPQQGYYDPWASDQQLAQQGYYPPPPGSAGAQLLAHVATQQEAFQHSQAMIDQRIQNWADYSGKGGYKGKDYKGSKGPQANS